MSNKDLKDFFPNTTQKPNFIFDVIMRKCGKENPYAYLVLDAMVRKIYGWWKDVDAISNSQLIEMTGLSEQTVRRSVKYLLKNKIIGRTQKGNGRKISRYKITIYEYARINKIEVPTRNPLENEVPNRQVRGTEQEPYKVPNGNPQKKEKKIPKESIETKPLDDIQLPKSKTLSEQIKELADNNNIPYTEDINNDRMFQNKLMSEIANCTNEKILERAKQFVAIAKRDKKPLWVVTSKLGFRTLKFKWDDIEMEYKAGKATNAYPRPVKVEETLYDESRAGIVPSLEELARMCADA